MGRLTLPIALVVALVTAGCAVQPTHDRQVAAPLAAVGRGNVDEAQRALDSGSTASEKSDLLYNLEKGELYRIAARYQDSQAAFELADAKVNEWEATARSDPAKLIGNVAATLLGDTVRPFEGQDYEKVMLTTRMAMNRINLGDLDNARVDIKRTHEREAVIAEFRAAEAAAAEAEAKKKGITGTAKELNGYPVETLNDPEVLELRNGFQNALSHYMAGFVYEVLNEPSLAAPGYRKAIELRPGRPVLEEGLRGLDQRTSSRRPRGVTDVLFIIEAGNAPARKAQQINLPIPTRHGLIVVPVSFPAIYPSKSAPAIRRISVGDQSIPTALIADFNVMARKALKDELPAMQLRAAVRAIGKGVIQDQINRRNAVAGVIGNIVAVATEPAMDDRMWRALPERVFIARAQFPPGSYDLRVPGLADGASKLTIDGRYMVVPVRILEAKTYFGEAARFGSASPVAITQPSPGAAPPRAGSAPKAKPAARPAAAGKPATAAKAATDADKAAAPLAATTQEPTKAAPKPPRKAPLADAKASPTPSGEAASAAAAKKVADPGSPGNPASVAPR